jgi:hypothetical protein
MGQWENASKFCLLANDFVGHCDATAYPTKVLDHYHKMIKDALKKIPTDIARVFVKQVKDEGDALMFMYSVKHASLEVPRRKDKAPNQPEFLAVDVDASLFQTANCDKILNHIVGTKLKEWTNTNESVPWSGEHPDAGRTVFQIPGTEYWATAIPVVSGEDRRVLLAKLMCDCLKNSKIVLLKLEKAEEPPTVNSEAFLAAVVKNAPYCKQMYNENQKLAEL